MLIDFNYDGPDSNLTIYHLGIALAETTLIDAVIFKLTNFEVRL